MRVPKVISRGVVAAAAIAVGLVGQHVAAGPSEAAGYQKSETDIRVEAALKERLPRTQVSRVDCGRVDGLCEVTAGSQLFYVDRSGRYLMIGRMYDMQTRQDLTAVRLLEVNPDLLVGGAAGSSYRRCPMARSLFLKTPPGSCERSLNNWNWTTTGCSRLVYEARR